jgi:hypothetical protein
MNEIYMKRKLKITIKEDHNHYALIEQVNNRENEINRGIFLDKDQYEQLRQHFVCGSLAFLGKILEEEMSAEMRTWLMELNIKLANDR